MQRLSCCQLQSNFSVRKVFIVIANISLLAAFFCIVFFSKDSLNINGPQDGALKIHFFNSALQSTPEPYDPPLNNTNTTDNSTEPSPVQNPNHNDTNQSTSTPNRPDSSQNQTLTNQTQIDHSIDDAKNQQSNQTANSTEDDHKEEPNPPITIPIKSLEEGDGDSFIKETTADREGASAYQLNGGKVEARDPRKAFLCRLKQHEYYCRSQYIAEELDRMWAFAPIYSSDQNKTPLMYKHHRNFVYYMKSFGIQTVVLEAIYPGQNYVMTTAGKEPFEIQLKIHDYFYYRENLLNVAIRKTKHLDYEYIIWIDAHQLFLNPYWWEDAIDKMARYPTVSLFQTLVHMNQYSNATIEWADLAGVQYALQTTSDIRQWVHADKGMWNGNAVGVRKEIYDKLGFILDYCIAGCCDCAFNYATMLTYWDRMDIFKNYGQQLMPWIEESRKVLGGENGVVRGRMHHFYHEHSFGSGGTFERLMNEDIDLQEGLYRDSNFTLHIKPDSILNTLFKKVTNIH